MQHRSVISGRLRIAAVLTLLQLVAAPAYAQPDAGTGAAAAPAGSLPSTGSPTGSAPAATAARPALDAAPPAPQPPPDAAPAATTAPPRTGEPPRPADPGSWLTGVGDGEAGATDVSPGSPRASLATFIELTRQGQWDEAAEYLDVPRARAGDAPNLARRLKAVIDRWAWVDLNLVSPLATGNLADKLPADMEEIARVPGEGGKQEPVLLVKVGSGDGAHWVFSRSTCRRIDVWFQRLPGAWLHDLLPEPLLRSGPQELLYWQWLALPLLVALAWLLGRVLGWVSRRVLAHLARKTTNEWDDAFIARIGAPLVGAWMILVFYLLLPVLGLYAPAEAFFNRVLRAAFLFIFFWTLWRTADIVGEIISHSPAARTRPQLAGLIPLTVRIAKVAVVAIACVAVLSELGYPVASLLAGLGIGGLAIALAAQKTVENLFGSISISVDQPFRTGDFVKIDEITGTVESLGLRSTRIRTMDRTVVTIPNGQLADKRIENYGPRDRFRLDCKVSVAHGTTSAQVRALVGELEAALHAHPKVWPESVAATLDSLGTSGLEIQVTAWFLAEDWNDFIRVKQTVLLGFMEIVERSGASLAFPSFMVPGRALPPVSVAD